MAGEMDPKAAAELAENTRLVGEYAEEALDSFQKQLRVVSQMRDAMEEVAKVMYALCQQDCKALNPEVWKKVTKEVLKNTEATKQNVKSVKEIDKAYKDFLKTLAVVAGGIGGLVQGFRNLFAVGKSILGFLGGLADTIYSVGKAIISIPLKILDGLFDMANQPGSNELKAALEAIRKEYGDLRGDSARAITDTAKNMKGMSEYGLNATRIFGDLAGRTKAVTEMVMGMGSAFQVFKGEIDKNGVAIALYQKGLGLSNEMMAGLATTAMRNGEDISSVMNDMTKQSLALGKQFGVSAKIISRDMGKAMQDVAHFGSLSTREMALAATYANKMGISIEKLTGIMDATKTYDQTVEGMSKLNETYGTNIDFMKMMKLESPAKQLQYLRDEFRKTGKDMSQLTRFDRDLIKQSIGLDDATIAAAFSAKNASVSYDKMAEASAKAAKTTLDQKDAIKALGKSIEELPLSGGTVAGGPFDHFLEGIARGIKLSPEFIGMMMNIREVLREAIWKGVELGRKFVQTFPGIADIFNGIKDIFNPKNFRDLWDGIIKTFDDFTKNGSKNIDKFISDLKDNFLSFFDKSAPAGQRVLDGFRKFGTVVAAIFSDIATWVIEKLSGIIDSVTAWIQNPKIPQVNAGPWEQMLAPLQKVFDKAADLLWPAIQRMASAIWDKIVDGLLHTEIGNKVLMVAFTMVFGPAILGALTSAIAAGMFKGVGRMIFGALAGEASKDKASMLQAGAKIGGMAGEMSKASDASKAIGAAASAMPTADQYKAFRQSEKDLNWDKIANALKGLALVLVAFMATVALIAKYPNVFTMEAIVKTSAVFLAVSASMIPLAGLVAAFSLVKTFDEKAVKKSLIAAAAVLEVGVIAFLIAAQLVAASGVEMTTIVKTSAIIGAVTGTFGAVGLLTYGAAMLGKGASFKDAAIGMGMMSLVLVSMVAVVGVITWLIEKVGGKSGMEKMKVAIEILDTMSNVFMKSGVILAEATAHGALAIFTGGASAAAAVAGFVGMAGVVAAMADIAVDVMKSIMKIKQDPTTMKSKISIFLDVLNSVTNLASVIPKMLESTQVGFLDILTGSTTEDRMDKLRNIVQTLLNGVDGKGGITGVIWAITGGINTILSNVNVGSIKSLEVIGTIFNAVGSLISAIGSLAANKVPDIKQEGKDNLVQIIAQVPNVTEVMDKLKDSAPALINSFTSLISTIPQDKGFLDRVKTLSDIIELINKVVTTVSGAIKNATGGGAENMSTMEGSRGPILAIGRQMDFIYDVFRMLAGDFSLGAGGKSLAEVVWMISQVPKIDKSSLDRAKNFSDFFETIAKINKSIFESTGGALPDAAAANAKIGEMGRSMYSIYWLMVHLLNGSTAAGNDVGTPDGVGSIGAIKGIMDQLAARIPGETGAIMKATGDNLAKVFQGLNSAAQAVTDMMGFKTLPSAAEIASKIQNFGDGFKALEKLPGMTAGIKRLTDFSKAATTSLTDDVLKTVSDMVTATQRLDNLLTSMPDFNIEAKMKSIAGGMGIGGKYAYSVASKEVVINVSFKVVLDTEELETALISNKKSVIRDRINFLIENTPAANSPDAITAYVKSVSPQGGPVASGTAP